MLQDTITLISGSDIVNMTVASGTSDPGSVIAGALFYRTDLSALRVYSGSTWSSVGSGGGSVTSVGLADGSSTTIYTITNSPVSTSGTLTFTLKTQNANLVFAGPATGSAAQPTFRALVAADIPAVSTTLTATQVGYGSGTNFVTGTSNFTWNNGSQILVVGDGTNANATLQLGDATTYSTPGTFTIIGSKANNPVPASSEYSAGGNVVLQGGSGQTVTTGVVEAYSPGGNATVQGGTAAFYESNLVATGGNLVLAGGSVQTTSGGTFGFTSALGGYISFVTYQPVSVAAINTTYFNTAVEQLRILTSGAFAFGSGGTNVGTSGQVLTSAGAGGPPSWTTPTSAVASVSGSGAGINVSPTTGAVVVTNTGVTSAIGTTNQVNVTSATGAVTFSLPQSIATSSTPTFAQVTISNTPVNTTDTATKAYVDAIAAGLTWKQATKWSTTGALTATYVGSPTFTLTNSGTQVAFTPDGTAATVGDRVLVQFQTGGSSSGASANGIYSVTTVGSGSTNWVLTRTSDFNEVTPIDEINGAAVHVEFGTLYSNTSWTQIDKVVTFDTDPIAWAQFSGAGSGVSSLTGTANQVIVSSPTGAVTLSLPQSINSGAAPTFAGTNFSGTAASLNIGGTAPAGSLTGTTLNATVVTSSLTTVGTIGTGTWAGTTVAINHGGTGQTTANTAYNALSPMTTVGDIEYEATGPIAARLPIGSTNQVLTVVGGLPTWAAIGTSTTATNIAGGSTNQIPFQSAASTTTFSADFTWTESSETLTLGSATSGPTIKATNGSGAGLATAITGSSATSGAGGAITITSGAGAGNSVGGALNLLAGAGGSGASATGGAVVITAGASSGSAAGGAVTITTGNGGTGTSGAVSITTATTTTAGAPGSITLSTGTSTGNTIGSVTISTGTVTNNNAQTITAGTIALTGGNATGSGNASNGATATGTNITVTAGSSTWTSGTSNEIVTGGNVTITAGQATTTGTGAATGGSLLLQTGAASAVTRLTIGPGGDWNLPASTTPVGTTGQVLTSKGSGVPPQWVTATGATVSTTGGTGAIQYNTAGALNSDTGLTFTGGAQSLLFLGTGVTGNNPVLLVPQSTSVGSPPTLAVQGAQSSATNSSFAGPLILQGGGAANVTPGSGTVLTGGSVTLRGGQSAAQNLSATGPSTIITGGTAWVSDTVTIGLHNATGGPVIFQIGQTNATTALNTQTFSGNIGTGVPAEVARIVAGTGAWSFGATGTNVGTSGQVLTSQGNAAPNWVTPTTAAIGSNTQIAFNNAGTESGDAGFTWTTGTQTLGFGTASTSSNIAMTAANTGGAGTSLSITGSTNNGAGTGGNVNITSGIGTQSGASSGNLNLNGGNALAAGVSGGFVQITGGASASTSAPGKVTIIGGTSSAATTAGAIVTMTGGTGVTTGNGGAVTVQGGQGGAGSGVGGALNLLGGTSPASGTGGGGAVNLTGGTAAAASAGNGGTVTISGGFQSAGATGGSLILQVPNSSSTYVSSLTIASSNGAAASGTWTATAGGTGYTFNGVANSGAAYSFTGGSSLASGSTSGGGFTFTAGGGAAATNPSGGFSFVGGTPGTSAAQGNFSVNLGTASPGNAQVGGAINLTAGTLTSTSPGTTGGAINLTAGSGATFNSSNIGAGGAITIAAGANAITTSAALAGNQVSGATVSITAGNVTGTTVTGTQMVGGNVIISSGTIPSGTTAGATSSQIIFKTAATTALTTVMTLNQFGNVAISSPQSGNIALTVNGVSGTHSTQIADSANNKFNAGFLESPINGQTANYQLVLSDSGKSVYLTGSTAAQTVTIPANGTVAYPTGTTVTIINDSTQNWSIAITTDTLVFGGSGTTGSRTLAAFGVATITKVTTGSPSRWYITGLGLT